MTPQALRDIIAGVLRDVRVNSQAPWVEAQFDGDNESGPTIAVEIDQERFIVEVKRA